MSNPGYPFHHLTTFQTLPIVSASVGPMQANVGVGVVDEIKEITNRMSNKQKRIGVYAGSFNPFHVGHANILHQALDIFDEVIVAIGCNPEKDKDTKEVFPDGNPILGNAKVAYYNGLVSDFMNTLDFNSDAKFYLVRGLRNGADLQYEQNQIQFIKTMFPSLKTVFFICDKNLEHVSSSALRSLKKVSEKEYLRYVFLPVDKEPIKYGWSNWDSSDL